MRCIVSLITLLCCQQEMAIIATLSFVPLFKGKQCEALFVHSHMQKCALAVQQKKICHDLLLVFQNIFPSIEPGQLIQRRMDCFCNLVDVCISNTELALADAEIIQ